MDFDTIIVLMDDMEYDDLVHDLMEQRNILEDSGYYYVYCAYLRSVCDALDNLA